MKHFIVGLGVLIIFLAFGWFFTYHNLVMYKFFGIRYEDTRREIFEHSKSYRQGMVQELQNMQFEYLKADQGHRSALADIILHRAADVDENILPSDLYTFIQQLKRERKS